MTKYIIYLISVSMATIQAMREVCLHSPAARHCGDNDKERIFFNVTSGTCQTFDWKTCTAGSNSFTDWSDCYHACVCDLDPFPVPCGDFSDVTSMGHYFFNQVTQRCDAYPVWHEGCTGNDNAFSSQSACKMACVCSLPVDPGYCDGREKAYFYNEESHRCEEFTYTGCGGNANRFETEEVCKEQCICGLPKAPADDEAQCMAYFPSVFYNSETRTCEHFVYGGCGGNNNRFENVTECWATCGSP